MIAGPLRPRDTPGRQSVHLYSLGASCNSVCMCVLLKDILMLVVKHLFVCSQVSMLTIHLCVCAC